MTTNTEETVSTDAPKTPRRGNPEHLIPGGGKPTHRKVKRKTGHLTPSEKAEAAALWRSGEVTLKDLSTKFKRRIETFSRLFKEMGIKKGEAAKEHQERVTAEVEARLLNDSSQHAQRIARVKDEHFKMADSLGKLVWQEIVRAKQAGRSIDTLRSTMHTLQMASATLSNVRKELYEILRVEDSDEKDREDDLPELTVRELTPVETKQLRDQAAPGGEDELGLDNEDVQDLPDDEDGGP